MFKKVELWFVFLIIIIFFIGTILFGAVLKYHYSGGALFPKIRNASVFIAEIPFNILRLTFKKNKNNKISIHNDYDMPPELIKHKEKSKFERFIDNNRNTLLVLPRYDGNKKRSVVDIIQLNDFKTIHTYEHDITTMNNMVNTSNIEYKNIKIDDSEIRFEYRHPLILEDGSLISHSESAPLFKIGICSDLIWMNQEERFHHSIEKSYDNSIWVPTSMYPYSTIVGNYIDDFGFLDDAITKVSQDGEILFIKSVSEVLIENKIKDLKLLDVFDPIHLNDIQTAKFDTSYWKKNDLFLSLPRVNAIIHYRPSTNKVINYIQGPFSWQHDVDIISDHEISIFNNNNSLADRNYSEIIIYDFKTKKFSKKFNESLIKDDFKTSTEGLSEILNDGSMLVEEQNHGRLIFYDKEGRKEWEFINKDDQGNIYFISWSRVIEDIDLIDKLKNIYKNSQCLN